MTYMQRDIKKLYERRMPMTVNGLQIRSFATGCAHEIRLPSGKTIVIDPFFGAKEEPGHTRGDITGADYILITHTHFDHELAAGYLAKKFGSKVFVGALSVQDFVKFHRIPYDNVFPVFPGQTYTLEDFTLQTWLAKHNPSGGRAYSETDDICKKETGIEGHQACDMWGSLESMDYLITTPNGVKMMVVSGRIVWDDLFDECKKIKPNILLRQAGMRKTGEDLFGGGQVTAKELAEVLVRYKAQLYIPFHYDVIIWRQGEEWVANYFEEVRQEIRRLDPGADLLYPKPWKWYRIGMSVEEE